MCGTPRPFIAIHLAVTTLAATTQNKKLILTMESSIFELVRIGTLKFFISAFNIFFCVAFSNTEVMTLVITQ